MSELPRGWANAVLGEVAEVVAGQSPAGTEVNESGDGLPFFQGKAEFGDLYPEVRKWTTNVARTAKPDDVLLSVRAPVGPTNLAQADCAIGRGLMAIRQHVSFADRYLLWVLRASSEQLRSFATGSTFEAVTGPVVRQLQIPVAPTAEQERIVAAIEEAFSKLDAGEAGLRTVRQLLKRLRDAVLTAAVTGRLVTPSGEIAYDDMKLESLRAESASNRSARPRRPRSDDVPPPAVSLPPGWRWVRWGEIGLCQNGRAFPSSDYCDEGVPLLRPGNLAENGQVRWAVSNTRHLPEQYVRKCPDLVVGPSEVVMNLTAQSLKDDFLGRVCLTGPNDRCLLNQRLARLTPFGVTPAYAVVFFRSQLFREFVRTLNTGSLIQHMYTHQVDCCWIPLPPPADQAAVVAEVDRTLSLLDRLGAIVDAVFDRSAGLRRSVLIAAFNGRLVPQDSSDEPAPVLLERIRAERSALHASASGRRRKWEAES